MKVKVFICYSHHDQSYLRDDSLLGYLKALERDGTAELWYDEKIVTGEQWNDEIQANIQASGIALVLVSQMLLNSEYITNEEIPKFIQKRKAEGMVIFPIILSACEWKRHDWLSRTQFLPRDGKNIESDYYQAGPQKEIFSRILRDLRIQVDRIAKRQTLNQEQGQVSPASIKEDAAKTEAQELRPAIEAQESEDSWINPFSMVTANDMRPDDILTLFVGDYTDFQTIKKHFDTLIEGQRGTGKTMVLRYLGLGNQLDEWIEKKDRPPDEFINRPDGYIGIYCRLEQGVFDKTDLYNIDNDERKERLFEHRLCLHCLACEDGILDTIGILINIRPIQSKDVRRLKLHLATLLQDEGFEQCIDWEETITFAKDTIDTRIIEEDMHLGSLSPGGNPTSFNPYLTMSGQIVPFLQFIKSIFRLSCPFFLMLDDFDVLGPSQQTCVFRTASARKLETVCFKYGIMSLGKKTSLAGTGRTYRAGDDYDPVPLDWTDEGVQGDYKKSSETIIQKRLEAARWPTRSLSDYFATWGRGKEIREEVRKEMFDEWQRLPTKSKPKTAENYWTKYGNARYFQKLSASKTSHRYSGFAEIIDISSGIYRQLLEICAGVVDKALARGWTPVLPSAISAETQNQAIRKYSSEMLDTLSQTAGDATELLLGDVAITSKHMVTLIESLSELFYLRLHSKSREPEIFCISLKDDLDANPSAKSILDVAVRESILHRRGSDYPPKTPGGPRLPTFMLNRRLAPRRSLGIRMQGRIEILSTDVELAVNNRQAFVKKLGRLRIRSQIYEGPQLLPPQ